MTVHRNHITRLPVNTAATCCPGCHTRPGRDHGLSCPDAPQYRQPLAFPELARVFAGLLVGVPIGAALWLIGALIAWSLA